MITITFGAWVIPAVIMLITVAVLLWPYDQRVTYDVTLKTRAAFLAVGWSIVLVAWLCACSSPTVQRHRVDGGGEALIRFYTNGAWGPWVRDGDECGD